MTHPQPAWRVFLGGAKKIISVSSAAHWLHQDDSVVLMDWIYYHEVSSEFSVRHWADAAKIENSCKGPVARRPPESATYLSSVGHVKPSGYPFPVTHTREQISSSIAVPIDALDLMRIICKRPLTDPNGHGPYNFTDMARMQQLKGALLKIVGEAGSFHDNSRMPLTKQQLTSYLYTCAALIYFNRAVGEIPASSFEQRRLVREGILILHRLGSCGSAWPLFVLACEANDDDQRLQISDVLLRTQQESSPRSNHVPLIRTMVEAIWNQNDLNVDSDVHYVETLHAVISLAPSLPLFA